MALSCCIRVNTRTHSRHLQYARRNPTSRRLPTQIHRRDTITSMNKIPGKRTRSLSEGAGMRSLLCREVMGHRPQFRATRMRRTPFGPARGPRLHASPALSRSQECVHYKRHPGFPWPERDRRAAPNELPSPPFRSSDPPQPRIAAKRRVRHGWQRWNSRTTATLSSSERNCCSGTYTSRPIWICSAGWARRLRIHSVSVGLSRKTFAPCVSGSWAAPSRPVSRRAVFPALVLINGRCGRAPAPAAGGTGAEALAWPRVRDLS